MEPCWFQWHSSFTTDGSGFSLRKAPLISSAAFVLTVCALSVTVAAISHILFILGAPLHTFVLISKCGVSCSQPEGFLSVSWCVVSGIKGKGWSKKLGKRRNLIITCRQGGSQCWVNIKSYPLINLTIRGNQTTDSLRKLKGWRRVRKTMQEKKQLHGC